MEKAQIFACLSFDILHENSESIFSLHCLLEVSNCSNNVLCRRKSFAERTFIFYQKLFGSARLNVLFAEAGQTRGNAIFLTK